MAIDPDHERLSRIFLEASKLAPEPCRAFLDQSLKGQPELRARVEAMLDADVPEDLRTGAFSSGSTAELPARGRIGPYEILGLIGEGGMGEVYLARQQDPIRRDVALKLIKPGLETKQFVARFEAERHVLARLNHPYIAQIYDAGLSDDGRPFIALEHVEGRPITRYCDEARLSLSARLDLFRAVCEGVQHAHTKGIIHRDIKASNVIVMERQGQPVPKIIDFGIAKAVDRELNDSATLTEAGGFIGTPGCMSPEQATMSGRDIDTRTDVYNLGVLLYELLTGTRPFESGSGKPVAFEELRRRVLEEEPMRPSRRAAAGTGTDPASWARQCRGDLDAIALKSLARDRALRYASPGEFSEDIERFLRGEAVLATPPSTIYLAGKFVGRHKLAVGSAATVLALLIASTSVVSVMALRLAGEVRRANEATAQAQTELARTRREVTRSTGLAWFLITTLRNAAEDSGGPSQVTAAEIIDRTLARVEELADLDPFLAGRILLLFAEMNGDEEARSTGRKFLEHALTTMDDQPRTIEYLMNLVRTSIISEEFEAAELILGHVNAVYTDSLGAADPETLRIRSLLGGNYRRQGRFDEARIVLEEVLRLQQERVGDRHPETLTTMGDLAALYLEQSRPEDADRLLSAVVEARADDLAAHYRLAGVAAALGDTDRALDHLATAVLGGFIYVGRGADGRQAMLHRGIQQDPTLALLHGDPRYEAIVGKDSWVADYERAAEAVQAGNPDEAIRLLGVSIERGMPYGANIAREPRFAPLRDLPRFRAMLDQLGKREGEQ